VSRSRLVLDTSPLIFLGKIEALHLLPALAEALIAPAAVVAEVRAGWGRGPHLQLPEAAPWLQIEPDLAVPPEIAGWDLGLGESQGLTHALVRPGWEAVLDDFEARRCAHVLRVPVTGTLGVILRAKQAGLIPLARPLVENPVRVGAYLPVELTRRRTTKPKTFADLYREACPGPPWPRSEPIPPTTRSSPPASRRRSRSRSCPGWPHCRPACCRASAPCRPAPAGCRSS